MGWPFFCLQAGDNRPDVTLAGAMIKNIEALKPFMKEQGEL